jgi:hypothetical protein
MHIGINDYIEQENGLKSLNFLTRFADSAIHV